MLAIDQHADVVIVGGGFAGVWAATSAAHARGDGPSPSVTLVNPRPELVIRPRLYERAPEQMVVPLSEVLDPIGVSHIQGSVVAINTAGRTVDVTRPGEETATLGYNRLVLASGSHLVPAPSGLQHLHNADTIEAAVQLDLHLAALPQRAPASSGDFTVIVVGAGFTGIELAAELTDRVGELAGSVGRADEVNIVLCDLSSELGPELGSGPRPIISDALDRLDVDVRLSTTVTAFDGSAATLSDGSTVDCATVIWAAGQRASRLTTLLPAERDDLGRLRVDQQLRVQGVDGVYAAGDTAAPVDESGHVVTQSCQHAMPQGVCVGQNVVADLRGEPLQELATMPYRTCLDLGPAGAVYTEGWDRQVQLSGADAKELKTQINQKWIYPQTTRTRP